MLNTRSGSWVITARHCATPRTVSAGRSTWRVTRVVNQPGSLVTHDVRLVQVDGNIKRAVGGGFALGVAPRPGTRITVRGFAPRPGDLKGCSGLRISYNHGFPQVDHCYLPTAAPAAGPGTRRTGCCTG
ncbi:MULTISPECIES: hypothetical protein [unclassified Luteococcus]|uniref:hypothetical protein n=1 Tax=unclassified Luteococcus TaxID=2639923 RepID=UPI00313D33AA